MIPGVGLVMGKGIVPGSQTYSTPGTYTFTPPADYNTLRIQVWAGGGSGSVFFKSGGGNYSFAGRAGNNSTVTTSLGALTANAGGAATGGSGSGPVGSSIISGGNGTTVYSQTGVVINSTGGNAGGVGGGIGSTGLLPGGAPGGGAGGYCTNTAGGSQTSVTGGGAGGYVSFSTSLFLGTTLAVVVGAGATASYSNNPGGDGRVVISWD